MLLAQMYHHANHKKSLWGVFPSPETQSFISTTRKQIVFQNRFPPYTDPGGTDKVVYYLKHRQTGAMLSLAIDDRSGKDWIKMDAEIKALLAGALGVMLLIDPICDSGEMSNHLMEALEKLYFDRHGRGEPDRRPFALCLAKVDTLLSTAKELEHANNNADAFVKEWIEQNLGDRVLPHIQQYCSNTRFFLISSVGTKIRHGVSRPVVFYDEALDARISDGGRPLNLLTPINWIYEQAR